MATSTVAQLDVASRDAGGSRAARRLRRAGRVPGVLYGGSDGPVSFDADARELRHALAAAGAVLELRIDGAEGTPVVVKEAQRDAVRGDMVHVDLLRVRLDREIHAVVAVELTGTEDAPGARQGGVIEHVTREVNVQALPTAIPEAIVHDVSEMEIGDTVTLGELSPPAGVTVLDDPETVLATLSPPRLQSTEPETEIEAETALVGEAEAAEDGESAGSAPGAEE